MQLVDRPTVGTEPSLPSVGVRAAHQGGNEIRYVEKGKQTNPACHCPRLCKEKIQEQRAPSYLLATYCGISTSSSRESPPPPFPQRFLFQGLWKLQNQRLP
ncbi:hypothetical protein BBP40_006445 [Aspergillus hancockii]|nr:hypothetical protein BBP40_006445 [Aspergillus hancockii]